MGPDIPFSDRYLAKEAQMNSMWTRSTLLLVALLLVFACSTGTQTSPQDAAATLDGTSWQLVKFQSSDGKTLTPDDKASTPSRSGMMVV
jgi:hypothetical protein